MSIWVGNSSKFSTWAQDVYLGVHECLPVCMYVYHVYHECIDSREGSTGCPGPELQTLASCHVGAKN